MRSRRGFAIPLLFLLLTAAAANPAAAAGEISSPPSSPSLPLHSVSVRSNGSSARLWLTIFDADKFYIRVIDNAAPGDNARYQTMDVPLRAGCAVAGSNGGFFNRTPFEPVGLMISESRHIGRFDPGSWMKGVLVVRDTRLALETAETFKGTETGTISAAIQSGPWLVREGRPETDNSPAQSAARTFVGHDGKGRWFLGVSNDCSLHHLAAFLRADEIRAVIDVQWALNLDGGPSTGLWVRGTGRDFYRQEKSAVRNYIAVVPVSSANEAPPE